MTDDMNDDMNDDDQLATYDLSAWDVPPPAAGLVDAVIARARQPAPVAALDSGERIHPRGNRRWWIAGAASAVALAAILVGVWGVQRTPPSGHGDVTAASARVLAIGPTTAALDRGAQVRWRRDRRKIIVAQPRGTAMWNVASQDTVVIDAGAMVATVEASGASLRVEVRMINASDARAVGFSAATAVAVALVTIVVYEGTVRVRHDGQTVNVVPGTHYEVRPPAAPEPIAVGAGPVDRRVAELEERIKQLERDALKAPAPCDADALAAKGDDHLQTGMDAAALAAFESSMRCRPDPGLISKTYIAACRSKNVPKSRLYYAKLPATRQRAFAQICIRQGIDLATAAITSHCQPADAYNPLDDAPVCTGGVINIASMPSARIFLDGLDTGKSTPATVQATTGSHKVMFVVGKDKYTFAVTVNAGETVSLTKQLE